MKIRQIVMLMVVAFALAWVPAHSEAALSSLSFSGSVDWLLLPPTNPNYVNTYDGHTFVTGKSMTGYLEYDTNTGETITLKMYVQDQGNTVRLLEAVNNDGPQYFGISPYVFEIQGNQTLTSLTLAGLSVGSTGSWYFDFDPNPDPAFRIGGDAQVVPIPAAFWLLGSGLVGLVGIRRRLQK